jgi:hypothetical protein
MDDWITEPEARLATGLGGTDSFTPQVVRALGEMKRDLALDIAIDPAGSK